MAGWDEAYGKAKDIGTGMKNTVTDIWNNFRPKYGEYRSRAINQQDKAHNWTQGLEDIRTQARPDIEQARKDYGAARDVYAGQIADPNKRGFGADTVNKMFGQQADVATAGRRDLSRGLNKAAAAGGMTGTGAAMRNVMTANERLSSDLLGARRDVDIANAQAQREDLARATQGMTDLGTADRALQESENAWDTNMLGLEGEGLGLQQNALAGELAGLTGENQLYSNTIIPGYEAQSQNALGMGGLAKGPGFWGTLGQSFARGLGSMFGGGGGE